jgi:hypothetical protein
VEVSFAGQICGSAFLKVEFVFQDVVSLGRIDSLSLFFGK